MIAFMISNNTLAYHGNKILNCKTHTKKLPDYHIDKYV